MPELSSVRSLITPQDQLLRTVASLAETNQKLRKPASPDAQNALFNP